MASEPTLFIWWLKLCARIALFLVLMFLGLVIIRIWAKGLDSLDSPDLVEAARVYWIIAPAVLFLYTLGALIYEVFRHRHGKQ